MFHPIKDGTSVVVDDLVCYLPPKPEDSEILYYNLPKEEQYWKREPMPESYIERMVEEEKARDIEKDMVENGLKKTVTYVDPVLERYRRREWHRRKYGVWFYNNGVATYITGHHYFYLQWCKFDHKENNGYPFYYEFSRDNFYFRQVCEEDPKCLGYMIIGPRGTGKSNEELAAITNNITMKHDARAALQSKSFEKDSQAVLLKAKLVPLFNNLPSFFKPEFSHGTDPKEALVFKRRAVQGKESKKTKFDRDLELTSTIFAAQPGEKVLDTDTLTEIFEDEIGKTDPKKVADVVVRHNVNTKCVFRNHRKIGLLRKTSTVEEMDEGGDECHKLWKQSDQKSRDKNGYTTSKIYRRLISALDTNTSLVAYIDEKGVNHGAPCNKFGQVNRVLANLIIQNDLDAVRHDLKEMSSRMRKSPRNVAEAFIKDQSKSIFNVFYITNRLEAINAMRKEPYVKGNLYWLNGKPGPVGFKPDEHAGRFLWSWFPPEFSGNPYPEKWKVLNNFRMEEGYDSFGQYRELAFPKNDMLFTIGTDPIKYSKTKDPRASKAAMHGFRKYDVSADHGKPKAKWQSHNFIFEYIDRPDDPKTSFDDVGMACHFLGCSVLPESNIKNLIQHFVDNGWEKFLMYPANFPELLMGGSQEDPGFSSTSEVINAYTQRLITFINEHCDRMPFPRTLQSWLDFDPNETTKYDATVSSGFTLVAAEKKVTEEEENDEDGEELFDMYDHEEGTIGKKVDLSSEFSD